MPLLIKALREKTQKLHQEIEAKYPFNTLLKQPLSVADYTKALQCLLHWYQLVEAPVLNNLANEVTSRIQMPVISGLLQRDLATLVSNSVIDQTTSSASTLQFNAAEALGGLYVMLGSALGSSVILKQVKGQHEPSLPSRFYQASAKNSMFWHDYLAYLDTFEQQANPANFKHVLAGAEACFSLLLVSANHYGDKEP